MTTTTERAPSPWTIPDQQWLHYSWLPELTQIRWEPLERLRAEQVPLFAVYRGSLSSVPALESKFASEDAAQAKALEEAVRAGTKEPALEITSDARRRLELQIAAEKAAPALVNLAEHVINAVIELVSHQSEGYDAFHAAIGQKPRAEFEADLDRRAREKSELAHSDELRGASVDEVNAANERQAQRERPPYISNQVRAEITEDRRKLDQLRTGFLSANGINTISDVKLFVAAQTGTDLGTSQDLQRHIDDAVALQGGEALAYAGPLAA